MAKCKFKIATILILIITYVFSINFCYAKDKKTPSQEFKSEGYVGTLPDLTRQYGSEENLAPKSIKPEIIPSKEFNSANEVKPVPREDPTFVNVILKTDKTSQYINDINEFIPLLEEIEDMIDSQKNVQLFNAKVYYFNKNAEYLRDKYVNKPEQQFLSYKKIMETSLQAKSVALLRTEAQKYNPYMSYESAGYIYNPNSINEQLEYLKSAIHQTLLVLKEAN